MLFPQNVHKITTQASKLGGGEKLRLIIGGVLVSNFLIAITIIPFFSSLGVHPLYPLGIQFLLTVFIGIFVFRIFIFREDEKILEYDEKLKDSFSKYYYYRNLDAGESVRVKGRDIPIYEFDNGSVSVVFKLRFGSNDSLKSRETRDTLTEIYNILGRSRLEFRQITSKEIFSETPEAKRYMDKVSGIENKKLAKSMLNITKNLFDMSDLYSNIDVLYLMVRTKYGYQRYGLEDVLSKIITLLDNNITAFKSYKALDKKDMLDFLKNFYGLEAIDLSLMRVRDVSPEEVSRGAVEVYQLVDRDGRVFHNKSTSKAIRLPRRIK